MKFFLCLHDDILNLFLWLCDRKISIFLCTYYYPPHNITPQKPAQYQFFSSVFIFLVLTSVLTGSIFTWFQLYELSSYWRIEVFYLVCIHHMFYSYIWCHGLLQHIVCVYLTYSMYCQYSFTHNLVTCMSFLNYTFYFMVAIPLITPIDPKVLKCFL